MKKYLKLNNLHKVKQEIERHGVMCKLFRSTTDEYGEDKGVEEVREILGLFHVSEGYEQRIISDSTTTHVRESPMLMVTFEDAKGIQVGDIIDIDGVKYIISAFNDISMLHIVIDMSMEVLLNGKL